VRAPEPDEQRTERWVAFARDAEPPAEEDVLPRFPIVRHGYDCPAVDQYIADLERELADADRELADVRGQARATDEVNQELKRIGEQTSAVLIAAHEQREEIVRSARREAEQCVAEATAEANARTAKAEAELRQFEARKAQIRRERDSLYEEIRQVSAGLTALIEEPPMEAAPQE
jgi:F0F1-type ATP synthase membrane subunit b/b'